MILKVASAVSFVEQGKSQSVKVAKKEKYHQTGIKP